jgi:hypothetical protein
MAKRKLTLEELLDYAERHGEEKFDLTHPYH